MPHPRWVKLRSAPTDHDGEKLFALARIGFHLGSLESEQQTAADFGGIVDRRQAGRMGGPVVVAEIAMARPGREHQNVIGNVSAINDDVLSITIDACDCAQQ